MDALDVARWQFGVTTVYHFLFVPISIGLSVLVAILQTAWYRTGNDKYLRLTKLYGKLFLINFAMGVVTGIVQEFQFGMNWSDYSRFVGDIFGAPLAIEALLAFFLESTFLGLWIFGWGRLSKGLHLATIWAAAVGTILSAYFILAANSFMQHPVGFEVDDSGRARLTDFGAVLTNKVTLVTFPHTIAGAFLTAGGLVTAVALWHLVRRSTKSEDLPAYRTGVKFGAWTTLIAFVALGLSGDQQAKIMVDVQPMKMAAAEALYETAAPASFSILTIGTLDGSKPVFEITIPYLLSYLSTGTLDGEVQGIDNLQAQYVTEFGPGSYTPIIPVTYWTFRLMIGFGALAALVALWALWAQRRGRVPTNRWLARAGLVLPLLPLAGNATGWIFTEMGRQPWIVFSEMFTRDGVSRSVSTGEVVTSFAAFTLLYGLLAVVEVRLILKYAKAGLPEPAPPASAGGPSDGPVSDGPPDGDRDRPLEFAY
jgi:cytochrome bd ubiquinol oxidase subunit I